MAYYRAQIDIRRPIEEVFAYLADFSNTEAWDPGVVGQSGLVADQLRWRGSGKATGREKNEQRHADDAQWCC